MKVTHRENGTIEIDEANSFLKQQEEDLRVAAGRLKAAKDAFAEATVALQAAHQQYVEAACAVGVSRKELRGWLNEHFSSEKRYIDAFIDIPRSSSYITLTFEEKDQLEEVFPGLVTEEKCVYPAHPGDEPVWEVTINHEAQVWREE